MRYVEEVCSDTVRAAGKGESVLQMSNFFLRIHWQAAEPARTDNSTLWLLKGESRGARSLT